MITIKKYILHPFTSKTICLESFYCEKCGHYANFVYFDGFVYCNNCGEFEKCDLKKQ